MSKKKINKNENIGFISNVVPVYCEALNALFTFDKKCQIISIHMLTWDNQNKHAAQLLVDLFCGDELLEFGKFKQEF